MRVYFYHTQDIQMILGKCARGQFPPHFLYGATKLDRYGIDVIWHKSLLGLPRWRMMLRNAREIIFCREKFDVLYATHYRGIEIVVFLRALGLFRKPVVIWHHQPVVKPANPLRDLAGRLFYRGLDRMFFFSEKLIADSLSTGKVKKERVVLGHWGMDVPRWAAGGGKAPGGTEFISSGKEMRDMETLVRAFNLSGAPLEIHVNEKNGDVNYREILDRLEIKDNIRLCFEKRLAPHDIAKRVDMAGCVCICCLPTKYTVGLTTLVEALALGKPVICSRNPQFPFSVDEEGCGISVDYFDTEGWVRAINYIREHPEEARKMGRRSKELALNRYNDGICAAEAARVLGECAGGRRRSG